MLGLYVALIVFPIGFLGALLGVGGGTFLVPILMIGPGFQLHEAIPISLSCALFTGLSGTFGMALDKGIFKRSLNLQIAAIFGVCMFSPLTYLMKTRATLIGFAIFILAMACLSYQMRGNSLEKSQNINPSAAIFSAFVAGACSGMFGIGGGIILVPSLRLFLRLPIKDAAQISLVVLISTSAFGLLAHTYFDQVSWNTIVIAACATVPAGILGRRIRATVSANFLNNAFIGFAVLMAVTLLAKAL